MNRIRVSLGNRSYDILVGEGLIARCGAILKGLNIGRDAVVVTNKTLSRLYGKTFQRSLVKSGISVKFELVPDSEKAKSHNTLIRLLNDIGSYDKNKVLFIIALGGGVIGDLAGFAAATYKRGIPYVQIPTTLLAQVDSAIGGKVAIDLAAAKNLVGSFYQPKAVISDVTVLGSLSARQLRSGLAECIKYGVIKDRRLFEYLERNHKKVLSLDEKVLEHIVLSSSKIKAGVVKEDEFDRLGSRAVLNYGHTIGHAIETACGYSKKYNHGEAIAIGMVVAAFISLKMGLVKKSDVDRIESLIRKCGLPVKAKGLKLSSVYGAHFHDKKFIHGVNRFVLPAGIGRARIVEKIPKSVVLSCIKKSME